MSRRRDGRAAVALLLGGAAALVWTAAASAQPSTRVRLATLNVENLFDDYDDPYRIDETTAAKSARSAASLAGLLETMQADIVALQEVESRDVLVEFLQQHLPGRYPYVACIEGNDRRGIDVALISRLPIRSQTSYRHRTWEPVNGEPGSVSFARDVLRVRVAVSAERTLEVLVLHLKSKRGGEESDAWRRREATEVHRIVEEIAADDPQVALVVTGDFNDLPGAPTLAPLLQFHGATSLFDLGAQVKANDRYSYVYRGQRQRLDYILASPAVRDWVVADSVRYLHHGRRESTDHDPLIVDLRAPGAPPAALPRPLEIQYAHIRPDGDGVVLAPTDLKGLRQRMGRWTVVEGHVHDVYTTRSGLVRFINFDGGSPEERLSGVIFRDFFARFPEVEKLTGHTVRLSGIVSEYDGRLQIVLSQPRQIQVLDSPAKKEAPR